MRFLWFALALAAVARRRRRLLTQLAPPSQARAIFHAPYGGKIRRVSERGDERAVGPACVRARVDSARRFVFFSLRRRRLKMRARARARRAKAASSSTRAQKSNRRRPMKPSARASPRLASRTRARAVFTPIQFARYAAAAAAASSSVR